MAGCLMEDASVDAVSRLAGRSKKRRRRLTELKLVGHDIAVLLDAAEVVHRRKT